MATDMPDPGDVNTSVNLSGGDRSFDTTRLASGWRGSPISGWINLFRDMTSGQAPNSVQADRRGIGLGKFILEHADLAKQLEETRQKFDRYNHTILDIGNRIPDVSITYFENWASTTAGLLLHAKPTKIMQVKYLIKKAKDLGVKVSIYNKKLLCHKFNVRYEITRKSRDYY